MGKTRGLVVKMECNDSLMSHHECSSAKCPRSPEGPTPPHRTDPPPPSSSNNRCGTPTTPVAAPNPPNADTLSDVDQEMEEQTGISTSRPSWGDDVENTCPPQAPRNSEPQTQAECLVTLHKTLESAMDILNKLSIHAMLPEHMINLAQKLYRRTKTTSSDEQGPSDNILSTIRKLAKDVEDLKRTTPSLLAAPPPQPRPGQAQKCLFHRPYYPP